MDEETYFKLRVKAMSGKNRKAAILAYCYECSKGDPENCFMKSCPLYPYRCESKKKDQEEQKDIGKKFLDYEEEALLRLQNVLNEMAEDLEEREHIEKKLKSARKLVEELRQARRISPVIAHEPVTS